MGVMDINFFLIKINEVDCYIIFVDRDMFSGGRLCSVESVLSAAGGGV